MTRTNLDARRSLLHISKLDAFKEFVLDEDYIIMSPTAHPYEVLRIRKYDQSGDSPDLTFYKKEPPTQHVTIPYEAEPLVRAFLAKQRYYK